jgi:hypothetical protein
MCHGIIEDRHSMTLSLFGGFWEAGLESFNSILKGINSCGQRLESIYQLNISHERGLKSSRCVCALSLGKPGGAHDDKRRNTSYRQRNIDSSAHPSPPLLGYLPEIPLITSWNYGMLSWLFKFARYQMPRRGKKHCDVRLILAFHFRFGYSSDLL